MKTKMKISLGLIGNACVGKSSLTLRLLGRNLNLNDYSYTIEDSFIKSIVFANKSYNVMITDTAGQEDFCHITTMGIHDSNGFMIVFSLNDPKSYIDAINYYKKVRQIHNIPEPVEGYPILLVGNKTDLERKVSYDAACSFCLGVGIKYIETSALNNENVELAFNTIFGLMIEYLSKASKIKKKKSRCDIL
ncbi:MAG: GTP-binding protein [Acidimicrobiales bacterium]